jgi:hypothetical protein
MPEGGCRRVDAGGWMPEGGCRCVQGVEVCCAERALISAPRRSFARKVRALKHKVALRLAFETWQGFEPAAGLNHRNDRTFAKLAHGESAVLDLSVGCRAPYSGPLAKCID